MEPKRRKRNTLLFCIYCGFMGYLLFHRSGYIPGIPYLAQWKFNLVPFRTIRLFLNVLDHPVYWQDALVNLGGNVILFIPLGFFLPRVFPWLRKFWRTGLATALLITAVELAQLLTLLGSCDIDDLILNVIGAAIGYGIHKLIK